MIISTTKHAFLITSFVFVMMLLIEYINVQTRGSWQQSIRKSQWSQYLLAVVLGATPGCLGAFTVVSLYAHRIVSFGALVGTMIATSGDEAYVMFSLFPVKAAVLTGILLVLGIVSAYLTDLLLKKKDHFLESNNHELELHQQEVCTCYPKGQIVSQLKNISFPRALLMGILIIFLVGLLSNSLGPKTWNWVKITFFAGSSFALFVVSTVPEHFLEQHLWEHVLKKHLWRIFLWTLGALLVIHFLEHYLDLQALIKNNYLTILIIAVLVGIIPESGPHMIFVTLFAQGSLPFSILLASSIVQDGHGTLPLLAVSKRGFVWLKVVNVLIGLMVGLIGLFLL